MDDNATKYNSTVKMPKGIVAAIKAMETISPKIAAKFAIRLFTTPTRHALPKREEAMDKNSVKTLVNVPDLGKAIQVYQLGSSAKKVLLVHGWSGRGTQLCSIAEKLVEKGYTTISFDAPAHGKSPGKTSDMTEFIAAILHLEKEYGPFEFAIGHSLGAMAVLNAIKNGFTVHKAITIGSGDVVKDIMDSFWQKLGMDIATGTLMISLFEKKFGETVNNYSAYIAAAAVTIPVLVVHDENDEDVPVSAAHHIAEYLAQGSVLITKGLGHRKILGDKTVIKQITGFLGI
jgi:pimeloyl-ACP methyl ester carboxylesterase